MADLSGWKNLEYYRQILRERAERLKRSPRVQVREDESDLVQKTFERAVESPQPCRGESDAERLAWLFKIQDRLVIDSYREHHAECRDVGREQALQQDLDASTAEYLAGLADKGPSPSEQAEQNEEQDRLAAAIRQLPDDQRAVVWPIVMEHKTPAEVADQIGKTEGSVAGLYYRGSRRVKEILDASQEN